jgi:2'-5' RNA ligase
VRWVRPSGMHVTLKFLGAVEPQRLERVHARLLEAVGKRPALRLRVGGLGTFPSLRRPRVVWMGLAGDDLAGLAGRVDAALAELGFAAEQRPFTPHVTLGRVRSLRGWPRLEEQLKSHLDHACGTAVIDAVTIYRSTLHPEGAVYTPLFTITLSRNMKERTDDPGR